MSPATEPTPEEGASETEKRSPEAEEKPPAGQAAAVRWMWRCAGEHILLLLAVYGILAFVIYLILVTVGPLGGLRLSTQLALGQVIIGWVALSLAIPGGYFAVREFMVVTAHPDLRLQFADGGQYLEVPKPRVGAPLNIELYVMNRGEAVARWWQVELTLDADIATPGVRWRTYENGRRYFNSKSDEIVFKFSPFLIDGPRVDANTPAGRFDLKYQFFTDRTAAPPDQLTLVVREG